MTWEERFWYTFQAIVELERDLAEAQAELLQLRAQDIFKEARESDRTQASEKTDKHGPRAKQRKTGI